jgi:hypothetical protein
MSRLILLVFAAAALAATAVFCEEKQVDNLDFAQVTYVKAERQAGGSWTFHVTVRHADGGWKHYADLWQIVDPQSGRVLGKRVLLHPHDQEQPFTRSLAGVRLPDEQTHVVVQAKCNVHGFGGREVTVDLEAEQGDGFETKR